MPTYLPKFNLKNLDQSGATSNQVPKWNATTGQWAPGEVSGGSGNAVVTNVTFTAGDTSSSVTVTGQTWVESGSAVVATIIDHPSGASAEEAVSEGATVAVGNYVVGTGFDVFINVPEGGVGPYRVSCVGV